MDTGEKNRRRGTQEKGAGAVGFRREEQEEGELEERSWSRRTQEKGTYRERSRRSKDLGY